MFHAPSSAKEIEIVGPHDEKSILLSSGKQSYDIGECVVGVFKKNNFAWTRSNQVIK